MIKVGGDRVKWHMPDQKDSTKSVSQRGQGTKALSVTAVA